MDSGGKRGTDTQLAFASIVFPMETHVDGATIRPYFNSGVLVVRPGWGLMRVWRDRYVDIYDVPALRGFYEGDGRYRVFVH